MPSPLYVIPAREADTALVFRRGPSSWWRLLEWSLNPPQLIPGAWFRGSLYPRRCDLSPNGRLLGYFALKAGRPGWPMTYFAVSKVPWLEALAAWKTAGTWTGGCHFAANGALDIQACIEDHPFHGAYPYPVRYQPLSLDWKARVVANEAKRGWLATPDPAILRRPQPNGDSTLMLINRGEGALPDYFLESPTGELTALHDATWCDWDRRGRLLLATHPRTLTIAACSNGKLRPTWSAGLTPLRPDPQPAPPWASHW
ncbi:MAG: hypothetical protein JST93_20975 [Acidobacteria bacterium]|nr:hypothetical protein [Acidobacteriota bacterium]